MKLSLCLSTYSLLKLHTMDTYWGSGEYLHGFLNSALDRGEWSASCFGLLALGERAPCTPWIGGCVTPQNRSGRGSEQRKSLHCPCRESNPCLPAHTLVTILTELPRYPVFFSLSRRMPNYYLQIAQDRSSQILTHSQFMIIL
jgi:hypothetical protein